MIAEIFRGTLSHVVQTSSAVAGTGVAPWVALMFSLAVAGMAIIYVRTKPHATSQ